MSSVGLSFEKRSEHGLQVWITALFCQRPIAVQRDFQCQEHQVSIKWAKDSQGTIVFLSKIQFVGMQLGLRCSDLDPSGCWWKNPCLIDRWILPAGAWPVPIRWLSNPFGPALKPWWWPGGCREYPAEVLGLFYWNTTGLSVTLYFAHWSQSELKLGGRLRGNKCKKNVQKTWGTTLHNIWKHLLTKYKHVHTNYIQWICA